MIILTIYFIEWLQHLSREKKFKKTRKRCKKMGTKIVTTGDTGTGKTTLVAGICTFIEKHVASLAKDKLKYVQVIICNYDFRYLNHVIDTMCIYNYDVKTDDMFNMVLPFMDKVLYKEDNHRYYFDGIKVKTYEELIKEYIEARVALNRNNFVWCNIEYYSVITGNKSFDLDPSAIQIKNKYYSNDFDIRRYSATFYDEETMDPNKKNTQWQRVAQEDGGAPEFYRVHRQLFKETSYYIGTAQHGNRIVKDQRELYNTIIHVTDRKRLSEYHIIKVLFKVLKWMNELDYKIKMFFIKNKDRARAKTSMYRKREKFCVQKLDSLGSKDFLSYDVELYESTEQEANHSRERVNARFVFPIKWCFSPINTWEFSYQYDELVNKSTKAPKIKIQDAEQLTGYFLSQKKKVSPKEAVKKQSKNNLLKEGGI